MSFVSSSNLIAVARTSSTMLNKSGKSRHTYLVPNLKGNICSFCPLSMMLIVGLSYMAFIMLRYDPSTPTLLSVFIINAVPYQKLFLHLLKQSCNNFCLSFCLCDILHLLIYKYCTILASLG